MAKPIRSTPAIFAPAAAITRDLVDIARNPLALLGGFLGMLLTSGVLIIGLMVGGDANAEDDTDELEMEFLPGELVRKGPKLDPKDLPEKIIVEETVAEEQSAEESVTKEEKKVEPPPEEKKPEKKKSKSKEKPDPNKKNVKKDDKNRDSNTPHKDLPTVKDLPGDPFAGPNGWSDMAKDGDPWATAVIGALNGIKPPSFGGVGKPGTFRFRITICPNGTISAVQPKSSTGDKGYDAGIRNEIVRVKIPRPPANVAKQLKGKCKRIPYEFSYGSNRRIR